MCWTETVRQLDPDLSKPDPAAGALAAVHVGTLSSTVLLVGYVTILSLRSWAPEDFTRAVITTMSWFFVVRFFSLLGWAIAVACVGLPVWWMLHRAGVRGRISAAISGGLLVGLVFYGAAGRASWISFAIGAASGALAGLAFEGVAYRGWCLRKTVSRDEWGV